MAYSLNKMWTAMAASLIAAAGVVSAAPNYYDTDCCDNYGQAGCLKPALDGCGSWFFSAEALYWRPAEDGLAYGTETTTSFGSESSTFTDIDVLQPSFRWDWGFRLGFGYDFSCGWDFRAYWTHYHGSAHDDADLGFEGTDGLFTTWGTNTGVGSLDTPITELGAQWRLRLDLADFELGREFCCGPCVSLRPHIGLRAVWINQKYEIEAESAEIVGTSSTNVISTQDVDLKCEFQGLGLRSGLDTQWCVGCGFSVYGNMAISAVYGTFHCHTEESNVFFDDSTESEEFDYEQHDSYHACRFITDLALGLRWSQAYCCDTVILTLQLGWEHHLFLNQNRFEDFANNNNFDGFGNPEVNAKNPSFSRGDKCLHGWTFGAKLDF